MILIHSNPLFIYLAPPPTIIISYNYNNFVIISLNLSNSLV